MRFNGDVDQSHVVWPISGTMEIVYTNRGLLWRHHLDRYSSGRGRYNGRDPGDEAVVSRLYDRRPSFALLFARLDLLSLLRFQVGGGDVVGRGLSVQPGGAGSLGRRREYFTQSFPTLIVAAEKR